MPTKANKLKAESKKRVKAANTRRPNWIDSFARQAGVAGRSHHWWLVPLGFSWPTATDNGFLTGDDLTLIMGPIHGKIL